MRRGHWSDRLPAIDNDIDALAARLKAGPASVASNQDAASRQSAAQAIRAATARPSRPSLQCVHTPPAAFHPGEPFALALQVPGPAAPASVHLHYRHVDQAERWLRMEMQPGNGGFTAAIPADYTQSAYPLQYYFELRAKAGPAPNGAAWLYPAFNSTLSNQPYYAVSQRAL